MPRTATNSRIGLSSKRSPQKKKKSRRRKGHKGGHKALTLALVLLMLFGGLVAYILTGREGYRGIDVSHHQGKINWEQVAWGGDIKFAYIKATEGINHTDPTYKTNVSEAMRYGIPVGAYHFFRADRDGRSQFLHFADIVGNNFDLVPMLDLEDSGGRISDIEGYRTEVEKFIRSCEEYYGVKPIVYSNLSFMRDKVRPAATDCHYWAAWYPPGIRLLPSGRRRFLKVTHPKENPIIWQYSDRGRIRGIRRDVDLNECWDMDAIRYRR